MVRARCHAVLPQIIFQSRLFALLIVALALPAQRVHAQACGQVTSVTLNRSELIQDSAFGGDRLIAANVVMNQACFFGERFQVFLTVGNIGPFLETGGFLFCCQASFTATFFYSATFPANQFEVRTPTPVVVTVVVTANPPLQQPPTQGSAAFTLIPLNPSISVSPSQINAGTGQIATGTITFDHPDFAPFSITIDPVSPAFDSAIVISPCSSLCFFQDTPVTSFPFTISTTRGDIPTTDVTVRMRWGFGLLSGDPALEDLALTRTVTLTIKGQPQFQITPVVIGFVGPLQPIEVPRDGGNLTANLPYKLGQRLTLEYDSIDPQTKKTTPISSTVTFQKQQPADMGNISDIFTDPTRLFPDNVLLHFTDPVPDEFFAIHSGKSVIDFKPKDASSGAPEVFLTVNLPSCSLGQGCSISLGAKNNQFDSDIVRFADFRGIPPQILKGQVQRESNFNPRAYRYEPLTVDFAQIFPDTLFISRFPAFSPYVLGPLPCPPDLQLPQSAGLDNGSPDVTPRDTFRIQTSPLGAPLCSVPPETMLFITRNITAQDTGVTMENILFTNDRGQHWTTNPGGTAKLRLFIPFQARGGKPFAAQTVIASSYGLIQVLYTTAVLDRNFVQNGVGRHPSDIFMPAIALDLGTDHLASLFENKPLVSGLASDPQFKTYSDLKAAFGIALVYYNSSGKNFVPGVSALTGYASAVLQFSDSYLPL